MTTESFEALRRRLLEEESVQRMIQIRAYEIYQMRGCQPGGEAHDWFHAESEVLAFLIAGESTQNEDLATTGAELAPEAEAPQDAPEKKRRTAKPRTRRSAEGSQTTRQSTAAKRTSNKKSTNTKTRSVRSRNQPKPEKSE